MKKAKTKRTTRRIERSDEVLPEHDFGRARPNKYDTRYAKGSIVVTLAPDVAAVFPGAREANDGLWAFARVIRGRRRRRSSSRSA